MNDEQHRALVEANNRLVDQLRVERRKVEGLQATVEAQGLVLAEMRRDLVRLGQRRVPGMARLLDDVALFHHATDLPIVGQPAVPPQPRVELRVNLIDEEVNRELLPAMAAGDLVAIADAMADAVYVIAGAALEYGIPLDRVWDAVQAANMAKVDPATGKVRKREDGKVLKPEGWRPPDIRAAIWG